jgi:hypothetical protein
MIKKLNSFLFDLLICILQFSGVILAIVLEDLSSKKMGVARYLVFKVQVFESTLFPPFLINIYTFVLLIGAVISLVLLKTKGKNKKIALSLLGAASANVIGIIFIQFKMELQAYPFFIFGIFIVIVFQYGRIIRLFYCFIPQKKK